MTLIDRNSAITSGDPHIALKQLYGIRTRYSDSSYKSDQADNGGRPDTGRSGPNRRSMESVTGMLERIGCGYLVLDRDKSVVEWNDAAQKTLEGPGGFVVEHPVVGERSVVIETDGKVSGKHGRRPGLRAGPMPAASSTLDTLATSVRERAGRPSVGKGRSAGRERPDPIHALVGRFNPFIFSVGRLAYQRCA